MQLDRVVILGANGTMGAGSAEVFAAGGCDVTLLARTLTKAREAMIGAQDMARSERIAERMSLGTYEADLDKAVAGADLVFEALAEDLELKTSFFERIDRVRRPDSVVATVSSGLSITTMARARSESFQRHFLGIHLFNPPNVIVGTEVIPHPGTDPALAHDIIHLLERRFGRIVIVCKDMPAFAGNRVGFKVLNEVAQLAEKHGVAFMDYLIGPQTGRSMPPLATVDLVGWDVHEAIVDNVCRLTNDEAHGAFALPDYMTQLRGDGHLGDKTPARGGFYRHGPDNGKSVTLVLDPRRRTYQPSSNVETPRIPFVEKMRELNRVGLYAEAFRHLLTAEGAEADLARSVVLGYVSYALNRVGEGEVVREPRDVDRIMGFGFNWAPPTVLVDLMGVRETTAAIERCGLKVPAVLSRAKPGVPLFREPNVNPGRFLSA